MYQIDIKFAYLYKALVLILFLGNLISNIVLADGLPGEYFITQRWRDLLSGHTPTTNPSFMTEEDHISARFAISPTLQSTFLLMETGVIVPLGLYQSIGLSYLGLTAPEGIIETKKDPNTGNFEYTGDTLKDNHTLIMSSYAINPWNKLSIGVNLSIFHETNFGDPKSGFAFDVGFSYRLTRHQLFGSHIIGFSVQNVFSPNFNFNSWTTYAANLKISWFAHVWEKRIELGVDMDLKDIYTQKNILKRSDSKEIFDFDINSRIGFWILRMVTFYLQAGSEYFGIAGGINFPTVNKGRDLQVAYQYMSIRDDLDLVSSHTIYFRGDFGKHREEIYANDMSESANIAPSNLWNIAMSLYIQEKYWDAMFIFGKIITHYPDYFKNDWAQLYLGFCQENLDMREAAVRNFLNIKKQYPKSDVIPDADLGILRIHYRNGNSNSVENQFRKLNSESIPDSIKFHAYYYMAQTRLKDREYEKAIQLFNIIPINHSEYAFAQHSIAIASALKNDFNQSFIALNNVVFVTPQNKTEEEIINRSFLLLGYIYYEGLGDQEISLSKAISALRKVPSTSYYYEDALLGRAWTALRANQLNDCVKNANELTLYSKRISILCEAALLQAYCFIEENKHIEAFKVLLPAFEKISSVKPSDQKNIVNAQQEYDNNRRIYIEISYKSNELALTNQSEFVITQIDSLRNPQIEYEKKLKNFYTFTQEYKREIFFERNLEKIRSDIEYALAKTEKRIDAEKADKIRQEALQKSKKIETEMEKLEKELKQLEKSQDQD